MRIVVKNIKNDDFEYIVYLTTEDGISMKADFANEDNLNDVIQDLSVGYEGIDVQIQKGNLETKSDSELNKNPLVLVFYLNRELMSMPEIMGPFSESINQAIAEKKANIMAFFIPTDDKERVECINPILTSEAEKHKINNLISDIEKSFDINQGADV
jgi:hypothetical protein